MRQTRANNGPRDLVEVAEAIEVGPHLVVKAATNAAVLRREWGLPLRV